MTHFIFCFALLLSLVSNAQTYAEKQAIPRNNLLKNPGFESGVKTGWTLTAGTLTADSTNELEGVQAASIALSAVTGTVITQTVSAAECGKLAGQNLELTAYVRTASSTVQVCSMSGGSEVQCQNVASTDTWGGYTFNLPAVASTSCGIRIKTSGSTTGTVKVDKAYVGLATNIGTASQATLYGASNYVGVANCIWTTTSGTYANFAADTDCNTPTGVNNGSAPSTKIPAVTFASLPPGDYLFVASDFVLSVASQTTNTVCGLRFSDGTNSFGSQFSTRAAADTLGGAVNTQLISRRTYTAAQTNLTVQIQGQRTAGDGTCQLQANNTDYNLTIHAYRYPSASEQITRIGTPSAPTVTRLTSGSGTYTPPIGTKFIVVEMVGGGGAGRAGQNSAGSNQGTATNGTSTTFGSSFLTAGGGLSASNSGTGGSITINSPAINLGSYVGEAGGLPKGYHGTDIAEFAGGDGGSSYFGPGGRGGGTLTAGAGASAAANTGGGGGGGRNSLAANTYPGPAGGAGGTVRALVPGPLQASYSYAVGAGGTYTPGVGFAGGNGGSGLIVITEYYGTENNPLIAASVGYSDTVRADGAAGLNTVALGTYTPTITNGTNITSNIVRNCLYTRVGSNVEVSCFIGTTCTTAALTSSQIDISLPIPSAVGNYGAIGTVASGFATAVQGESGYVFGNTSTARARWNCSSTAADFDRVFKFAYKVQ